MAVSPLPGKEKSYFLLHAKKRERERERETNEDSKRDLWDKIKCTNSHNIDAQKEREREIKGLIKYLK